MIYYGNELYHHGIKGQKWGERNYQYEDGSLTPEGKKRYRKMDRQAKKDAKEYARAKMFYGEGAGNRRKLINATVKERSKDPMYDQSFKKHLSEQDMDKHVKKAKQERRARDIANSTAKTIRGAKNTFLGKGVAVSTAGLIAGMGALYLYKSGKGKQILDKGKEAFSKIFNKPRKL